MLPLFRGLPRGRAGFSLAYSGAVTGYLVPYCLIAGIQVPDSDVPVFHVIPFYRKWLADLRAAQKENGKLSNIAPMQQKELAYFDRSAGWGDAMVIVPYMLYRQYGDTEVLRENYAAMKGGGTWATNTPKPKKRRRSSI